jgi:Tfp pilus assembly protein FimT
MQRDSKRSAGFSVTELLVVVGIVMLISVISIPSITRVVGIARMRASMTSLSGVIQNTRMTSIKENRTMTMHLQDFSNGLIGYIKPAGDASGLQSSDPQVQLQAPITDHAAPVGTGAPTAITTAVLGFTPVTGNTSFNSRGLPCEYSSGTCISKGFIRYFKDTSQADNRSWAAVSVSPAGRIKRWFWSGSEWVD